MKLHRDLGVTRKTAWFLAHRIRANWQDASAWLAAFLPSHPLNCNSFLSYITPPTPFGVQRFSSGSLRKDWKTSKADHGRLSLSSHSKASQKFKTEPQGVFQSFPKEPLRKCVRQARIGDVQEEALSMKGREKSFADPEWENKKHRTRREKLPEKMKVLMPWEKMLARIKPYYGCAGKGSVPYPLESMLRVHCVQLFYNLSDPGREDLLYEAESVRRLTGPEMGKLPDESTILNCRHRRRAPRVRGEAVGDPQ